MSLGEPTWGPSSLARTSVAAAQQRPGRRRAGWSTVLAIAAALAAAASGCTIGPETVASGPSTTAAPATAPSTTTKDPVCRDANPRPSLRPPATLPAPSQMPAGSYMATIAQRGKLIVGVSQDTYLFSYLNPDTGQIEGFDVDVAKQVAKAIFGDENHIELRAIAYADRLPKLESGELDLVADTMTVNCARWARIKFSTVYYEAGQKVLLRRDVPAKSIADLAGRRLCAATGSTSIDNIRTKTPAIAVDSPDWVTCLVRLQQGEVDGISTDDTILAGLAFQDPYTKILDGKAFTEEPYGLGMNRGHDDFVRFVNGVLDAMRANGTWQALYDRELKALLKAQTPPAAEYRD